MAPKNKGTQEKAGTKEAGGKSKSQGGSKGDSGSSKGGIVVIDTRDQKDPGPAWKKAPLSSVKLNSDGNLVSLRLRIDIVAPEKGI